VALSGCGDHTIDVKTVLQQLMEAL